MRSIVNAAQDGRLPPPDRFFGILSQHLAGIAEAGAFGVVPDPDLWGSVAGAGAAPGESVLSAAAGLGRNWRNSGNTVSQFAQAQAALREKIWGLCELYADESELELIRTVALVNRWLDTIGVHALGEIQSEPRPESGRTDNAARSLAPANGLLFDALAPSGDEELDRLIAEVTELQVRRDGLSEEIDRGVQRARRCGAGGKDETRCHFDGSGHGGHGRN